jgi:signal transduction histidine kinase
VGDSEIVELIRYKDWSQTHLGPIESWPGNLQTTVSLCLASSFPINLIWGPGYVQIWNEGYSHVCGEKHPGALGSDYRECWASAWPAIGKAFETACAGETAFLENQPMFLDRNGYLEETCFTFSLSPIRDEKGVVVGLFHPVTETTPGMLSERRSRSLRDLASRAVRAHNIKDATSQSLEVLSGSAPDLPFLLLYLGDEDGHHARLAGCSGLEPGRPISPHVIDLAATDGDAPVAHVMQTGETSHLTDVPARFGGVHAGPYPEPLQQALLLPINPPGATRPAGVLFAGVSTRLPLGEIYRGFFDLVAAGVTSALANAIAYERERERAEALAEIDRAKTTFFSNVSHEFRTPLTLMIGPLEDELEDTAGLESRRRERLETAHRNSLRLLRLVNSLLEFSRIESGRAQASYLPTDLAAYTVNLASLFRSATEKAGLELTVECEQLPEPLFVDHSMWEKIVLNLLSNAFKHTFEGAIALTMRWRGEGAELSVTDTGIGIAAEEIPHLFERFHRVKDARSRTIEGSGIGLALVQELTQLHGGEVRVESEQGRGSTFTVSVRAGRAHLPVDQVGDTPDPAITSSGAVANIDEALGWLTSEDIADAPNDADVTRERVEGHPPRARVLLADDNADMRTHVRRLLEPRFEVTAHRDGAAALRAALADPPDLVLTDVMMPQLDGFGLLAALRQDDRTRTIPVIMLSARAGEEAGIEGIDAGADDYLVKPFSARELIARVTGCLTLAQLRQEAAQQLQAANRELAVAASAKSQFLANMSHEIRTPMNAIIGMTSLMLETPLTEEQQEYAETVCSGGEHLLNLINEVLDFSKIEAGALDIEEAPFSLQKCVQGSIDIITVLAKKKRLKLTHHIEPGVPDSVIGDAGRLRQILINLLNNAVKFTEAGEVRLTVSAVPAEDNRTQLRISVHDTGIGIAEEDQSRLFDAFIQVDGTRTRTHEGTGLGLAISAQLAELMGGAITVHSTPGEGSTFDLTVLTRTAEAPATVRADPARTPTKPPKPEEPREPPKPAEPREAPAAAMPPPPTGLRARGASSDSPTSEAQQLRILVVDDNHANQRVTTLVLGRLGYASDVAGNGPQAIETLERQSYDLVFMDMQMPQLDGLDTTRRIRARWPAPQGPWIIGITGYASEQDRRKCMDAGMNDYLAKPVTFPQYREALTRATAHIGNKPSARHSPSIHDSSTPDSRRRIHMKGRST